jgi:hypothetical protein
LCGLFVIGLQCSPGVQLGLKLHVRFFQVFILALVASNNTQASD